MANKKLEEAMRATSYTHHQTAKSSQHTGKSHEEPARPASAANPNASPAEPRKLFTRVVAKPERTVQRRVRPARIVTQEEVNEGATENQPAAQSRAKLPPDPFPLEYRQADPNYEFESE